SLPGEGDKVMYWPGSMRVPRRSPGSSDRPTCCRAPKWLGADGCSGHREEAMVGRHSLFSVVVRCPFGCGLNARSRLGRASTSDGQFSACCGPCFAGAGLPPSHVAIAGAGRATAEGWPLEGLLNLSFGHRKTVLA